MSSSAYDVVAVYTRTIFSVLLCYAQNTFHFLFLRTPTPAWLLFALEWCSRWPHCKVVKHSSRLFTSSDHDYIPYISVPLGSGSHSFVVLSMLVELACPSTLASAVWKEQTI